MPTTPRSETSGVSRRGTVRSRLASALAALTDTAVQRPERVTVSEVCRLAGVSRNTLYRYHAPILAALRRQQHPKSARRARRSAEQRRQENVNLRERVTKLAALVDHYFTAYRETATLLERRERDLAELRSKLSSQLTVIPLARSARSSH